MAQASCNQEELDNGTCSLSDKEPAPRVQHCTLIPNKNESENQMKVPSNRKEIKLINKSHLKICSNPDCESKDNLRFAPYFVCAYFGLLVEKFNVRRVCQRCYRDAENHQSVLVKMLGDHKSIVLGPKKPKNQMVTIDDEECSEDSTESPEEVEIEGDIDNFVKYLVEKYRFEEQVDASLNHLEKRWINNKDKMAELDISHSKLEKNLDSLRKELYKSHEPKICLVDSIDVDTHGNVTKHNSTSSTVEAIQPLMPTCKQTALPPNGMFIHTQIKANQAIYAMRSSLLAPWGKGRVIRIKENTEMMYVIRFDTGGKPRTFPLKYLAYAESSPVQLTVGARVIAQYVEDKDGKLKPSSYYAGVIAEAPKTLNQYRYLVFFDDGYAQYCTHEQVTMVCQSSRDVWQDIHMNSRSFVLNYLKQYPERAMVKLQRGQTVKTELNGNWFQGRVETVDASLANIYFPSENRFEWIYRGSTRLHPLFDLLANAEARKNQGATRPTHNMALVHKKKNAPYVEYTRGDVDRSPPPSIAPLSLSSVPSPSTECVVRAVARKSTSKVLKPNSVSSVTPLLVDELTVNAEHKGRFKFRLNESYKNVAFEPHQCNSKCIEEFPYADGDNKNLNPLSIPMLCGWSREVAKQRHGERLSIIYRAPCGRRMRNMDEVHRYIRLTGSQLGVDLFCFDNFVHCFTEFEPEVVYSKINDITYGKENVRVSCVNSIDRSNPEYVEYSTERIPREGVNLNLDPNFLVCCDCTDDCQDKEKCQCWQLTIKATALGPSGKIDPTAGYNYRRLMQNVVTGVYECNSRCSCRKTCINRVAQRPLHLRLQLFRTERRGWGIRCLDDIPKGQFICVYAGQLLTEQEANEDGKQFGDEYLAELDLIESIEQAKDGYESDVDIDIDHESDISQSSGSDDSGEFSDISESKSLVPGQGHENKNDSSEKLSAHTLSSTAVRIIQKDDCQKKTRELYGPNEHCYVMDAKSTGNIGRYLNHCCKPNVFVQNIFVDTQDLRFPWVGFFAHVFIRAGTELTWDYSYQVDSVPDKKLFCHCGAKECRGRLL
ncbi:histone-lysine N-methyltransferase SETDB1-like isoform X2 [Daphnia pulex]|uniref:histone-lysine N-methyltransferase SETDB1-like isoform X2 n=1 Tax=Daphnia pulex TaxID=6669 RepID=UPI001EDD4B21|nr:histone-lysine N-methyltransferase SETDB1-like isoform X2 [Daphnia pulex]